ncbi:MAG: hypothetical protein AAF670_19995 [Planctomycetota bacterium]
MAEFMGRHFNLIEMRDSVALLKGLDFRRKACGFFEVTVEFFPECCLIRIHAIDSK